MTDKLVFILCCILSILTSNAQSVIILDSEEKIDIGKNTLILEDTKRKLSPTEILESDHKFNQVTDAVFNSKPTLSAFWIKFKVKNETGKAYFLEINNPTLHELGLYHHQNDSLLLIRKGGDKIPYTEREILRNNYIFSLDLPKGATQTFYLRYTTTEVTGLPLSIGTAKSMMERAYFRDLAYGFFYGILFVTLLYNFFLFLSLKDSAYITYVVYITCFGLLVSGFLGLDVIQFIFPNQPTLIKASPLIMSSLTGIFSISFGCTFLQTKLRTPNLHKIGYLIQGSLILGLVISAFNQPLGEIIISTSGLFISPYLITMGIIAYKNGYKPARFYLLAAFFVVISLMIFILKGFTLLPFTTFTSHILQIGFSIEAILFSLALGDRYKILKKENEEIQLRLNKELQLKIEERTKAQEKLKRTNQNLVKTNSDLDNFIYTASHDLKAPISNLEGLLTLLKDPSNKQEEKSLLSMMTDSIEKFKGTIHGLTEISKVQKDIGTDIESINFSEVVEETKMFLKQQLADCDGKIVEDFSHYPRIYFSKKNLRSIIFNLVSNAIKYKSQGRPPVIKIKTQKIKDYVLLSISDNGLGIPSEQHETIFKMFKRYHTHTEGTGVGLYIIKRIIENAGGKIELESTPGKGSTFNVYLKEQR